MTARADREATEAGVEHPDGACVGHRRRGYGIEDVRLGPWHRLVLFGGRCIDACARVTAASPSRLPQSTGSERESPHVNGISQPSLCHVTGVERSVAQHDVHTEADPRHGLAGRSTEIVNVRSATVADADTGSRRRS